MRGTLTLLLFALFIVYSSCSVIYFDTNTTRCELPEGCNWDDPLIWIGEIVPANETEFVYLNDTRPNIYVIFNTTNKGIINSLFLGGITLGVLNSSSLSLGSLILDNATMVLDHSSAVYSYESIKVQYNSSIDLHEGTQLNMISGTGFYLDESSSVFLGPRSILKLISVELYGDLEMFTTSSFEADSVVFGHSVTFSNLPILQNVIFRNAVNGSFLAGLSTNSISLDPGSVVSITGILTAVEQVTLQYDSTLYLRSIYNPGASIASFAPTSGTLVISSSNVTIENNIQPLVTNIIFAGNNTVTFSGITITDLSFTTGENGEDPYVSIRVNHEPVFFELKQLHLPADFEIDSGFIAFSGESSISGGIVSRAGTVVIDGKFTAGGPIVMVTVEGFNPITALGSAILTTPLLHFQQSTELSNSGQSTLIGNLQIDGTVRNYGTDTLTIFGNYIQNKTGQLVLFNIDPLTNYTGYINVTGHAYIDGIVAYAVHNNGSEGETKFPILFATEGIHGKFVEELKNEGPGNVGVRLEYTEKTVYFVYGKSEHHHDHEEKFLGLEWWSWALIALAGTFVFVFLIPFTYYRLKIWGKYEPIEAELAPSP